VSYCPSGFGSGHRSDTLGPEKIGNIRRGRRIALRFSNCWPTTLQDAPLRPFVATRTTWLYQLSYSYHGRHNITSHHRIHDSAVASSACLSGLVLGRSAGTLF
jgi:hypothetical protein